jgi:hypothetical protein
MVVVEDDYFNLVGGMCGWAVAYRAYLLGGYKLSHASTKESVAQRK